MSYDPGRILLVNFGEYFERARKLGSSPPSIAQIPLLDYKGFPHVAGYLSKPERTSEDGYEIGHDDLQYVWAVARAFRDFPVNVKCEGMQRHCKNRATRIVVPYQEDRNREEKIAGGGPEFVNQTYVINSSFRCKPCAEEMKHQKGGRAMELGISFSLPGSLTRMPERRSWNFNRADFHGMLRGIACQLADRGIGDLIDTGLAGKGKRIDRYAAQRIVSRLAGCMEDDIPEANDEYETRELDSYAFRPRAPTWEEWQELRKPENKSRRSKDNRRQLRLALS
jgi:hypothetical protein